MSLWRAALYNSCLLYFTQKLKGLQNTRMTLGFFEDQSQICCLNCSRPEALGCGITAGIMMGTVRFYVSNLFRVFDGWTMSVHKCQSRTAAAR